MGRHLPTSKRLAFGARSTARSGQLAAWVNACWTLAGALALLWPSHVVGPLDGIPLDQPSDAFIIGLLLPALWWLGRDATRASSVRMLVVLLLTWKVAGHAVLQQQGLCGATYAAVPWSGTTQTIRVAEPSGALRSWDLRADWRDATPHCTTILTRPLYGTRDFPAWFVNITDQMLGHRNFSMAITGHLTIGAPRRLQWNDGIVDTSADGAGLTLERGTHALAHVLKLSNDDWRFAPTLDDEPLWDAALVTVGRPGVFDHWVAPWGWAVTPIIVVALAACMAVRVWRSLSPNAAMVAGVIGAAAVSLALAFAGGEWARAAGVVAFIACAIPVRRRLRNLRGAFLLIGIPWLTFFATWSRGEIGRFTIYSYDDWLAYQVAGYRIFMNGYFLEAGTPTFDYQPLYRWISGALHLVFGDSSVGEVYLDAAALLAGALLAFSLVRASVGFRGGLAAAAATLATVTLGTSAHFIGRGLSEISAAGCGFVAIFFLLRGRRGKAAWIVAATVMAVLMVYARLNHLLWAPCLAAFLLPRKTPASAKAATAALSLIRRWQMAIFAGGFATGVLLIALRTFYYTGVFSLFHGTSLRHNDTGLRPWTLLDAAVWSNITHSIASFISMTEPPRPDPRSLVMVAGVVAWTGAVLRRRIAQRMPASLLIAAAGAAVGALFAHAHPYPGRFSIHAVPLASAMAILMLHTIRQPPTRVRRRVISQKEAEELALRTRRSRDVARETVGVVTAERRTRLAHE
jgi:hypothetical protein